MRRRTFLQLSGSAALGAVAETAARAQSDSSQARSASHIESAEATLPRNRVPLSFIIDDSTCLVNMGHFCMPQFAEAHPDSVNYKKPWRSWPREIPDSFVRRFGTWCAEHGVKGKYSIVPNPACVGWLDRELPGWSRRELRDSLQLVRDLMVPNWDIHPEMITHTRVIDLKTGRPIEPVSRATMENSFPQQPLSVDQLAEYLAYALRLLKNCDLPCEGITTPGGFGNLVKKELGLAAFEAVRDVYSTELPHYFKYIAGGDESTAPRLEHVRDLDSSDPKVVVNVPAGTGDWFGGWDGDRKVEGHRYSNADATSGRMVDLILRREPAVMLCHWPGMYCQGSEAGFQAFQRVVLALADRFADQTRWMKVSEIARYWTAKELTQVSLDGDTASLSAPFACEDFTMRLKVRAPKGVAVAHGKDRVELQRVDNPTALRAGRWCRDEDSVLACFDLARGESTVQVLG